MARLGTKDGGAATEAKPAQRRPRRIPRELAWFAGICVASAAMSLYGLLATWREADFAFLVHAASLPTVALTLAGAVPRALHLAPGSVLADISRCFMAGTLSGIPLAALAIVFIGLAQHAEPNSECGPAQGLCAAFVGLHIANMGALLTFGLLFPGLMPFIAAFAPHGLHRDRRATRKGLCIRTGGVTLCTAFAAVAGFALSQA